MNFPSLSSETAPAAARPMLLGSQKQFGFIPSPVAKAAASPTTLKHLFAGFAAFDESSLSHLEREVVAMTVAFEHGCHYCMALHSALLTAEHGAFVAHLRAGTPLADARLEALRVFVRALVQTRGRADTSAFEAAGYTEANALDVVLGVGVYTLSTYLNILTSSELDPPFVPFAWSK
jgi:AhpD family alkylhydroperoxidase